MERTKPSTKTNNGGLPITQNYIKEGYATDKYPNAKLLRDRRAKQLRKQGYTVKCQKWNFTDLARCQYYTLEAEKQ